MTSSQYALDDALCLHELGAQRFEIDGSKAYWNFTSAFGGWMVAAAISAVRQAAGHSGDLLSVNAIFPEAIPAEPIELSVRTVRQRSRTSFWHVCANKSGNASDATLFEAQVVLSKRAEHEVRFNRPAPTAPDPSTMEESVFPMGPKWLTNYRQKFVEGQPFTRQSEPRTLTWIEEGDARPWDELGIAAICDTFMPRVFFADTTPRFGSTVSLGIQMFATGEQVAALGTEPLLLEANSDAIALGSFDQRGRIWSKDGQLIAVTNQVAVFR